MWLRAELLFKSVHNLSMSRFTVIQNKLNCKQCDTWAKAWFGWDPLSPARPNSSCLMLRWKSLLSENENQVFVILVELCIGLLCLGPCPACHIHSWQPLSKTGQCEELPVQPTECPRYAARRVSLLLRERYGCQSSRIFSLFAWWSCGGEDSCQQCSL